jgi:hypothetical protein
MTTITVKAFEINLTDFFHSNHRNIICITHKMHQHLTGLHLESEQYDGLVLEMPHLMYFVPCVIGNHLIFF